MKRQVEFSIIIPIYNCEKYIEKCINSILVQKFNHYELLLIDDGSTDSSGMISDIYAKKNKQIKVFHKKNEGVSAARNVGIQKATGKYILFMDSDDYIEKDYLSYCSMMMKKYRLDLLNVGFYSIVECDNKIHRDKICAIEKMYENKESIKKDLVYLWDKHMLYNIWNKVYLNSIIKKNNIYFPLYDFGEDMDFNIEYMKYIQRFYNSKKCFYNYIKERKDSLTHKYRDNLFQIRIDEFYKFNQYFEENGISRNEYIEFSSRRYIERFVGCIENVFHSKLSFFQKYKLIRKNIYDDVTRESLIYAKSNSIKMKILLFPIRYKMTLVAMLFGKLCNVIRRKNPGFFNKMKNKR